MDTTPSQHDPAARVLQAVALVATVVLAACSQQPDATVAGPTAEQVVPGAAQSAPEEKAAPAPSTTADEEPAAAAPEATPAMVLPPQLARALEKAKTDAARAAAEAQAAAAGPPDGEWLVDDEGRKYYVERFKKYPGTHRHKIMADGKVRYMGVTLDVVDEDEEWFYAKVYSTSHYEKKTNTGPTAEELEAVAATYPGEDVPAADRLRFTPFGALSDRGQWRNGFEIADINGDGQLDIVHGPPRKGQPWPVIFLGDGAGNWRPWREATFPDRYDYGDVAVADFDGDGNQDLVLGIHLRGVRVLLGDGAGAFREWSEGIDYRVPGRGALGFSSRTVEVLDWNADGRPDVLALGEGPRLGNSNRPGTGPIDFIADGAALFINQGDGTWVKLANEANQKQIFGDDLALGDFNADGRIDFATGSSRMGRRDVINLWAGEDRWAPTPVPTLRPRAYIRAVTVSDFDRDGIDDLAVAYLSYQIDRWRNGIDLLYTRPEGEWERHALISREGQTAVYALDHGDLDGDGNLDLAALDADGEMLVFLGDGEGSFVREEGEELEQPGGRCRGYHLRLADLDGDGRDEVVAGFADEASALYDPDRCPSGGALVALKAEPRTARVASGH